MRRRRKRPAGKRNFRRERKTKKSEKRGRG